MTKTKKIWLGIFTFLPIVFLITYFIFFFVFFFNLFGDIQQLETIESNSEDFLAKFMSNFAILFAIIMLTSFVSLGLLIYYIMHANNNPKNDSNTKLMWTLVLIFTSSLGSVIYYILEILPIKNTDVTVETI